MKIFLDTADQSAIAYWHERVSIDGVTTNPTHLAAVKQTAQFMTYAKALAAQFPTMEISVQVTELNQERAYQQAKQIAALAKNIVVKVPCLVEYYPVIKRLVQENIAVNVTLVFTLSQALFMARFRVRYISIFVGRASDIGMNEAETLMALTELKERYGFESEILAASIRDLVQFEQAVIAGVDVITIPPTLLEKLTVHPQSTNGAEIFQSDFAKGR
jgi:transaldolase